MSTIDTALQAALQLHRAGNLTDAKRRYREIWQLMLTALRPGIYRVSLLCKSRIGRLAEQILQSHRIGQVAADLSLSLGEVCRSYRRVGGAGRLLP